MPQSPSQIEAVDLPKYQEFFPHARAKTWEAIKLISEKIRPGMTQKQGYELALAVLAEMGAQKNWHRPFVYFGQNTAKNYNDDAPDDGVILGENDLYSIDLGPVWRDVEGDAGATFSIGTNSDHQRICDDVKTIFHKASLAWKNSKLTGSALYDFAEYTAENLGWNLSRKVSGHRISEFPHALYTKARLADLDFAPTQNLWVLEIHITDPDNQFGAFDHGPMTGAIKTSEL